MRGNLEVITGPMMAGKTTQLVRLLRQAQHQGHRVAAFGPQRDTRAKRGHIQTHDGESYPCRTVSDAEHLLLHVEGYQVVGIDEVQFFGMDLVGVVQRLADAGHRVIVAGLDQDAFREPFGPVPALLAVAEHVTKMVARCEVCGAHATMTRRTVAVTDRVLVGGRESYSPRCRCCWEVAP